MALSLGSMFQPFNDFFMNRFATKEGERVQFRFARLPHTFVDADFRIGMNPDASPSAELALQLFSEAVDSIATLDIDGRRVSMGTSVFSDLYFYEILNPSTVLIPSSVTDEPQRQAVREAFEQVKADAKMRWEKNRLMSLEAGENAVQYRPSTPAPSTWWNKNAAVWTHQSFQITGAASLSNQPVKSNDQLLRMKIDDGKFRSMLTARVVAAPVAAAPPAGRMIMTPRIAALSRSPAMRLGRMPDETVAARPVLKAGYKAQIATLPVKRRMAFYHEVAQDAPTQTVASTEVTISFDFCVVNVERQWLHQPFLNNRSWYIPGQSKGELSANDGHGAPAIPVGCVAIKNLRIKAPWTPEDISNLANSVQFGPFNFSSNIVDGALCHDDIQVVAWMLEDLPDLPPNAAP